MLTWHKIHKQFGGKVVARSLDLSVADGELVAVLGPSGSGKSTLLNLAAGLVMPDSGRILLDGDDITQMPPEQRHFALMFQDYALFPHLNVWQNVAFGLRMRGINKKSARSQAEAMLMAVDMSDATERDVVHLSGGEQQRVALARALVTQPKALLLDEPFSALDTTLRAHLQQLMLRLVRAQNCPTVLVTHSPQEALVLADRVCLFQDGEWVQMGTAAELLARPISAWAARLLGCDNVSEDYYVPQRALKWRADGAPQTRVVRTSVQADAYEVWLDHAQWGRLRWWLPLSSPQPVAGSLIPVVVDDEQVVVFSSRAPERPA
ncbi:ABC transporter ATP-binding protein [Snodgrassella sp. CFCC 13594]|uniref:ABC transporter ATP-binding protein n=1 Tax=Snodgrassella sp. CFCC 13594 TaxID=1775559 RepID=UPI00082E4BEE|nr:ABC transporter ATP-binding protein [Snodgrassella sp. CFCC 13594]